MTVHPKIQEFVSHTTDSLTHGNFVKLSLGNYRGTEPNLKNIYIKRVLVRNAEQLSFTYHYKTRDIVKNHPLQAAIEKLREYMTGGFYIGTLFTTEADWICENIHDTRYVLRRNKPTHQTASLDHNRDKKRLITGKEKSYLQALGVTDAKGEVLKTAQDKFKQINKYIEILSGLLKDIPAEKIRRVVDMGSGKGYLTFALYDYLANTLHRRVQVTGVEYRQDMVDLCNKIAGDADFAHLDFTQGTIEKYDGDDMDVLVALHACDTATDEALYKGITAKAELIVVAPCCHKQIRREVEKNKAKNDLDFLLRHGIFMERECEMVTDAIRALVLEYFGYSVKVFEFISDAHTAKNVLIVATRTGKPQNKAVLEKIKKAKDYFGIKQHKLEQLLEI